MMALSDHAMRAENGNGGGALVPTMIAHIAIFLEPVWMQCLGPSPKRSVR